MPIKLAIFDNDGVLCDSGELYHGYFNHIIAIQGKPSIPFEEWRQKYSAATAEENFTSMGSENPQRDAERFLELTRLGSRPKVFPDVHDTLRWLKEREVITAVVSAHPTQDLIDFFDAYRLRSFISAITGGLKPAEKAQSVASLIKHARLQKDKVVYVDDMDTILAAVKRTVGCVTVGITRGYCSYERIAKVQPDKIASDLRKFQFFLNFIEHRALSR